MLLGPLEGSSEGNELGASEGTVEGRLLGASEDDMVE